MVSAAEEIAAPCRRPARTSPLVVEVADSTLRFDRDIKVPLYAVHGITDTYTQVDEPDLGTPLELFALSGVAVDLQRFRG